MMMQKYKAVTVAMLVASAGNIAFHVDARGQCTRSGLDDGPLQITKGTLQVDVEYDNAVCGTSGDTIPTARAQDCLDAVDDSYDLFVWLQ